MEGVELRKRMNCWTPEVELEPAERGRASESELLERLDDLAV
jgi:hypothetical protein